MAREMNSMTGKWSLTILDNAVQINPPVPLARGETYPFVDMQGLHPGTRDVGQSEHRIFSGGGSRFMSGDTLMARITPCLENGKIARFKGSMPLEKAHGSTEFIVIRGKEGVTDNDFAYYLTRSDIVRERAISQMTGSSGRQRVPIDALRRLEVPIPSLAEQRAIAEILGSLDDKIELNRRMNETLEAMARAIFKSWFVDFDPVRAKMEGRWRKGQSLPGLPSDLYDLFPDHFVDSELGEIPAGWKVGRVSDIGIIICGKTPSTRQPEYYGDDVPFITIPDMHGKTLSIVTQKRLSHAGAASQHNKMLPPGSICVSCIATPGLVVITSEVAQTNQQINSVIPINMNHKFFWYWILRELGDDIRASGSGGSVLSNLSTSRFAELRILAPTSEVRSSYHSHVATLFDHILATDRGTITLAAIRDALLPKLISGQIHTESKVDEIRG